MCHCLYSHVVQRDTRRDVTRRIQGSLVLVPSARHSYAAPLPPSDLARRSAVLGWKRRSELGSGRLGSAERGARGAVIQTLTQL